MGYTVDKKTGQIILVHDVTVEMPEPPKQTPSRTTSAPRPAAASVNTTSPATTAAAHVPGAFTNDTFTFPVTRQKVRTVWHEGNVWFVAKDVAECLGFTHPQSAIIYYCNHAKVLKGGETPLLTSSPRGINIIPESRRLPPCHASRISPPPHSFKNGYAARSCPLSAKNAAGMASPRPPPPHPKPQTEDQLYPLRPCRYYCPEPEALRSGTGRSQTQSRLLRRPCGRQGSPQRFTEAGKLFGMSAQKLAAFPVAARKGRRITGCSRGSTAQISPTSRLLTVGS